MQAFTVLIVEDDPSAQEILVHFLEELQITGYLATNGIEGIDMARRVKPDLILLDLMMPRLDGLGFLNKRQDEPSIANIPVIITSAIGLADKVKQAIALGATDYLRKPIDLRVLEKKIAPFRERVTIGRS